MYHNTGKRGCYFVVHGFVSLEIETQNFDFSTKVFLSKIYVDRWDSNAFVCFSSLFISLKKKRTKNSRMFSNLIDLCKFTKEMLRLWNQNFGFRFRGKRICGPQKYNDSSRCLYHILVTISVSFNNFKIDLKLSFEFLHKNFDSI